MRRIVVTAVLGFALGYAGLIGWLLWNEDRLVFRPEAYGGRDQVPVADSVGLKPAMVTIPSSNGAKLAAWMIRSSAPKAPWLVLCHGNAGNISLLDRQRFYRDVSQFGINLLAFDYRGYGASSDLPPSEQGLYDDGYAAYRFLTQTQGVPPTAVVIYGHSLGAGVATYLAARVAAAGVILEGAFTSIADVGQGRYPMVPVRLLARNRFDSAREIIKLRIPVLIMHARRDATIPFAFGRRLFELAPEPKTFLELAGDHDSAWEVDRSRYLGELVEFVKLTTGPDAPPPRPHGRVRTASALRVEAARGR